LQVDEEAGAYAGLALGLQVVMQAVGVPLVFRWLAAA
jgi:putative effector of murein hydrolase